ncbi:MAG: hypothetical protein K1000chlam3_00866 [Chlamydiae bacterium]|nr:hypothetical protein [Chlamydiota bacterium]
MKRPLSLLEVCIGLALTAILLTTLFSGFRHLMKNGAKMGEVRHQLHPYFVMQMRLNQIFESITEEGLFYTDIHEKANGKALYFTFQNGVDPDPQFCGEIEGVLYCSKEKEMILELKDERSEIFLTEVSSFKMKFYDPKENKWVGKWGKNFLPPLIKIHIGEKEYSYLLPRATREAKFS